MKSGISFYNGTALKKDITRNFPLWGLYLLGLLLTALQSFPGSGGEELAAGLDQTLFAYVLVNFAYALLAVVLLFGDLFKSRLCNALHAMPLRREGWFLVHLSAGILMSLVPNFLVSLVYLSRLGGAFWSRGLIWAGIVTLQYVFFFGAAVFSAMCAGNLFGMTLIYGLINGLTQVVNLVILSLYEPLLYGIRYNPELMNFLFPLGWLGTHERCYMPLTPMPFGETGWPYLLGMVAVGVVLLLLALLLYRRRRLETAGDFIAVRPVRPVFLILYTMLAGVAVYLLGGGLTGQEGSYAFLAVGITAGYFTGQMLLHRKVRVFGKKSLLGFAIFGAVLFGSLFAVRMDPMGVVGWMPDAAQVRRVEFSCDASFTGQLDTEDPGDIAQVMALHRDLLEQRPREDSYHNRGIEIRYTLADGSVRVRQYRVPRMGESALVQELTALMSKPEYVFSTRNPDAYPEQVQMVWLRRDAEQMLTGEQAADFVKAMLADCRAGTMAQTYDAHEGETVMDLEIYTDGDNSRWIQLWPDSVHSVRWLQENGFDPENGLPDTEKN